MKQIAVMSIFFLVAGSAEAGVFGDSKQKREMQRRVQERMEAQFRKADTNNDGYLSREEAEKNMPYIYEKFDLMDTDKDGRLTIKEISAHNEVAAGRNEEAVSPAEAGKPAEGKGAK